MTPSDVQRTMLRCSSSYETPPAGQETQWSPTISRETPRQFRLQTGSRGPLNTLVEIPLFLDEIVFVKSKISLTLLEMTLVPIL